MHKRKRIRGLTLLEVLMASSISVTVLFTAVMLFVFGMAQWSRGQAHIAADTGSQAALRAIQDQLREAMAVSVDANGLGLSYRLPALNTDGSMIVPAQWDNVARRIYYANGEIDITAGDSIRTITKNVVLTDPQSTSNSTYRIFTAGTGSITRQLTIMVVTKTNEYKREYSTSRSRETVYLRNIPELTKN